MRTLLFYLIILILSAWGVGGCSSAEKKPGNGGKYKEENGGAVTPKKKGDVMVPQKKENGNVPQRQETSEKGGTLQNKRISENEGLSQNKGMPRSDYDESLKRNIDQKIEKYDLSAFSTKEKDRMRDLMLDPFERGYVNAYIGNLKDMESCFRQTNNSEQDPKSLYFRCRAYLNHNSDRELSITPELYSKLKKVKDTSLPEDKFSSLRDELWVKVRDRFVVNKIKTIEISPISEYSEEVLNDGYDHCKLPQGVIDFEKGFVKGCQGAFYEMEKLFKRAGNYENEGYKKEWIPYISCVVFLNENTEESLNKAFEYYENNKKDFTPGQSEKLIGKFWKILKPKFQKKFENMIQSNINSRKDLFTLPEQEVSMLEMGYEQFGDTTSHDEIDIFQKAFLKICTGDSEALQKFLIKEASSEKSISAGFKILSIIDSNAVSNVLLKIKKGEQGYKQISPKTLVDLVSTYDPIFKEESNSPYDEQDYYYRCSEQWSKFGDPVVSAFKQKRREVCKLPWTSSEKFKKITLKYMGKGPDIFEYSLAKGPGQSEYEMKKMEPVFKILMLASLIHNDRAKVDLSEYPDILTLLNEGYPTADIDTVANALWELCSKLFSPEQIEDIKESSRNENWDLLFEKIQSCKAIPTKGS